MNPFSLLGKKIVITGASSGIGASTAIECSRMGATVIITGRNETRLKNTLENLKSDGHTAISCDLTDDEAMKNLVEQLPKIDGIVLCAGVNQTLPIQFFSRIKINGLFDTNFFSPVELVRLILKKKLLNENASIVAMSSIGGNFTFSPGASAYGASKAALLSWMKTSAKELAPKYRVNCICPGQINTPMNATGEISSEQYETYKASIPMKRFGEPEEIAYATIYLLSDVSKWVTGSSLVIDGGSNL